MNSATFSQSPQSFSPFGPSTCSADDLRRLDGEILRLARSSGALRLRVGEALEALCRAGGHHELGFSSSGAYVRERCSRGARWGQDARALARRLAELPRLRRAVLSGEISWSMAQVLAAHAGSDTDESLCVEARTATVRAMRARLREREASAAEDAGDDDAGGPGGDARAARSADGSGSDRGEGSAGVAAPSADGSGSDRGEGSAGVAAPSAEGSGSDRGEAFAGVAAIPPEADDEEEAPRRVVSIAVPREEAWMWEATLKVVEHVSGHRLCFDDRVEALLAESWTTLLGGMAPGEEALPGTSARNSPIREEWRQQLAACRDQIEEKCEARFTAGDDVTLDSPLPLVSKELGEMPPFGVVRSSPAATSAVRTRYSAAAARVRESLTGGIDREDLIRILAERGLPTTLQEAIQANTKIYDEAFAAAARQSAQDSVQEGAAGVEPLDGRRSGRDSPTDDTPTVWSPEEADAEIRRLMADIQSRDVELGRSLLAFFRADGWRRLGYANDRQYARERVGLSLSSVKAHMALARRTEALPEVAEAAAAGRIGYESARLVARAALPQTAAAWVERAAERTVKHLREEVEAIELVARCEGWSEVLGWGPPEDEVLETIFGIEREIRRGTPVAAGGIRLAGSWATERSEGGADDPGQMSAPQPGGNTEGVPAGQGGGQMSAPQAEGAAAPEATEADAGQMSAPLEWKLSPRAGQTVLRLNLREDVADLWDSLRILWKRKRGRLGLPSFVCTLCWSVWHAWGPSLGPKGVAYEEIFERELWRCASPVCDRTDLTCHHLTFRSQGGTDDGWNLSGPCSWCHLEGIHTGRIKADPPASKVRWRIGRSGLLRVEGRKLVRDT